MIKDRRIRIVADHSAEAREKWEKWARKGNWGIRGYKIIRAPKGPGPIEQAEMSEFMVIDRPHGVCYEHSLGLVGYFNRKLKEDAELWGTKCPKCGTVYCPPRAHCWNPACRVEETEWVKLPNRGAVWTFTPMLFSADAFLAQLPMVLCYVNIEGTNTAVPMNVVVDPTGVFIGMELEIQFKPAEERTGDLMDVFGVPVPYQEIPETSVLHRNPRDVEDLRRDLEKTYQFVEKVFGIDNRPK
jgi:hypothetical protein